MALIETATLVAALRAAGRNANPMQFQYQQGAYQGAYLPSHSTEQIERGRMIECVLLAMAAAFEAADPTPTTPGETTHAL